MRATSLLLTLALACVPAAEARSVATSAPSSAAIPTTPYEPGPHFMSGTLVAAGAAPVLRTVEHGDVPLDLGRVRSVWKETDVPASALEAGDELMVSGTRTPAALEARYVWANIGRADGIIRAVDGDVLTLEVAVRTGQGFAPATRRYELSRHVTFVAPLTRADLRPGRTIGAVLYRPKTGLARLTRIW